MSWSQDCLHWLDFCPKMGYGFRPLLQTLDARHLPPSDQMLRKNAASLTSRMASVLMVNGQTLNSTGYVRYV